MVQAQWRFPVMALVAVALVTVWSAINPHDWFTWKLETFPVFLGIAIMMYTYSSFRLTDLLYGLIAIHCIILLIGGHYTYAEVPWFNWLRDEFHLARNYYDRVGHFVQGFVPALLARELLLRTSPLASGKWMFAIIVLGCLGVSAGYELLEWLVAIMTGEAAESFLGTQGDVWDTQEDMATAFVGAICALVFVSKCHDKSLAKLKEMS